MHNLSSNFYLFLDITKSVFKSSINAHGNFKFYSMLPKLSDCQIIALSVTAESIGIDSENYLFGKLKKDYKADFLNLIHRSNFNRRRKTLAPFLQQLNQVKGVFHSMDLSKASVHDIHYLNDVKYSGLNNCILIGDKGYLSKTYQTDLFNAVRINLKTAMRNNQQNKERFEPIFRRFRKRIETLFAQLCDQFMLKKLC